MSLAFVVISHCEHGILLEAECSECAKIRPPAMKCHYCGRFTKFKDVHWEMPYVYDLCVRLEPPENVPVCKRCAR